MINNNNVPASSGMHKNDGKNTVFGIQPLTTFVSSSVSEVSHARSVRFVSDARHIKCFTTRHKRKQRFTKWQHFKGGLLWLWNSVMRTVLSFCFRPHKKQSGFLFICLFIFIYLFFVILFLSDLQCARIFLIMNRHLDSENEPFLIRSVKESGKQNNDCVKIIEFGLDKSDSRKYSCWLFILNCFLWVKVPRVL